MRARVSSSRGNSQLNCRFLTEVFAKAGLLEASEGRGHVGLVVGVHEDGSGLQALAHVHGLVDVAGEHPGGQAVLGVVGPLQHSFHIPAGQGSRSGGGVGGGPLLQLHHHSITCFAGWPLTRPET